jgi:predicted amidophosphoribosyltransferase
MKYLYKIFSGYDKFTPARIPERMQEGRLRLGWERYLDEVEVGDEVWVYYHGPHSFTNGVYAKGIVKSINREEYAVFLKIRESSVNNPLTDAATSERVAQAVSTRNRQVFLFPEEWDVQPECKIQTYGTESCKKRLCEGCPTWKQLPLIAECGIPERMGDGFTVFAPAYWVIPKRCYVKNPRAQINRTSEIFYRFKTGEEALSFPLAIGIFEALKKRNKNLDFDCITPIPLSPDKVEKKEMNRTMLLAQELSRRIDIPVVDLLGLSKPISKRRGNWSSERHYEDTYYETLTVSEKVGNFSRILLIDDVCTRGSTLKSARRKILATHPNRNAVNVSAASAGQMIITGMVTNENEVRTVEQA